VNASVRLEDGGKTVCKIDGSSHKQQQSAMVFEEGQHKVALRIVTNPDSAMYVGVGTEAWRAREGDAANGNGCWTMQADGYTYSNGSSCSGGPDLYTAGRILRLHIDMDAKTIQFKVDGNGWEKTLSGLPAKVFLQIDLQTNGQKVTIEEYEQVGTPKNASAVAPKSAWYTNGDVVCMVPPGKQGKRVSYKCGSGDELEPDVPKGEKTKAAAFFNDNTVALPLTYDPSTNAVWSYDGGRNCIRAWLNDGLVKRFFGVGNEDPTLFTKRMMGSDALVAGAAKSFSPSQASIALLSELDRIASPYAPTDAGLLPDTPPTVSLAVETTKEGTCL